MTHHNLFLSSVRMLLDARKFWCIFVLAVLKTNPFSHHLSKCNFIQNWTFSAFWYNSEIPSDNPHNVCNNV